MSDWKNREPDFGFRVTRNGFSHWDPRTGFSDEVDCFNSRLPFKWRPDDYLVENYGPLINDEAGKGLGIVIEDITENERKYLFYVRNDAMGVLVACPGIPFTSTWVFRALSGKTGMGIGVSSEEAITGYLPAPHSGKADGPDQINALAIIKTAIAFATREYGNLTDEEFEQGVSAGVDLEVVRLLQSVLPAPKPYSRPVGYVKPSVDIDALRRQVREVEAETRSRYHAAEFGEGIVVHKDGKPMAVEDVLVELRRGAGKAGERA